MHPLIRPNLIELLDRNPAQCLGLRITDRHGTSWRDDQKAHVMVLVRIFSRWVNDMDIEIDGRFGDAQTVNTRLFSRLA
jgi:hypothetical protein